MAEPLRITGYRQSLYLAHCHAQLRVMEQRIVTALRSKSVNPIEYIQAIGDLLAMIDDAQTAVESAQGTLADNGYIDPRLDPAAQARASLAAIINLVNERESLTTK